MAQLPSSTVPQWWRERCREGGERPVLRQKRRGLWTTVTWAGWYAQSRAIGLALAEAGVQPGEVVSILADNRAEWLVVDLAAQAMGFIGHGIYPGSSAAELAHVLTDAGSRVVVVDGAIQLSKLLEVRALCPALRLVVVMDGRGLRNFDDPGVLRYDALLARGEALSSTRVEAFEHAIDAGLPGQLAMLVYSAGSTGRATGAAITQHGALQQMRVAPQWLKLEADERTLSLVSLAHAGERMLTLGAPLASGCIVHFPEGRDTVLNDLQEVAPQLIFATPHFWERLHTRTELSIRESVPLARGAYRRALARRTARRNGWFTAVTLRNVRRSLGLQNMRMAITGGAPIGGALLDWYAAIGVPMFESYGLAQTSGFCAVLPTGEVDAAGACSALARLRVDADGQILVRGAGLMAEGWNARMPDRAAPLTNADGWLATGDFGVQETGGRLRVLGRMADRFTASGEWVAPGIIESEIKRSFYVADALVFGEARPYCVSIVALDEESVGRYAQERQLPFTDYASLVRHPEVVRLIDAEVAAANARLPTTHRVREFRIIERQLAEDDEELAPTMRLRRHVVERVYGPLIDAMYSS